MTNVIRKTPDACGIYQYAIAVINPGDYPTDEWLHDPVVSHLTEASPTVPSMYWKVAGSPLSVVEMTQGEKDAVDVCRGQTVSDDQTFDDDAPAGATNIWSSLKIDQTFSKRDRVCIRHCKAHSHVFQQTYVPIFFDYAEREDTTYFAYGPADGRITVLQSGWYWITAEVAIEASSTSRNSSVIELRLSGATVESSKTYGFHYAEDSAQTLAARGIMQITSNQFLQIYAARDWGKSTLQTKQDSCRIAIVKLDDPE